MAILDIEKYYYFKMRNGSPYDIKESIIHINTTINRLYQEMTTEQKEFYLEHPTATVMEVWNCELVPPYVPPTPDVQEYANEKVRELKEACYASVTIDELQYAMANAVLAGTSIAYAGKKHYSTSEAIAIMKQFMDESDKAVTVYDTYKSRIEAAVSVESIDLIYNEAMEAL
ncbi:MAG: hypothetical protein IKQ20_09335 [Bacteroidales bacterium]|nr:hypothetical protein [Bacteroidales bacterium]